MTYRLQTDELALAVDDLVENLLQVHTLSGRPRPRVATAEVDRAVADISNDRNGLADAEMKAAVARIRCDDSRIALKEFQRQYDDLHHEASRGDSLAQPQMAALEPRIGELKAQLAEQEKMAKRLEEQVACLVSRLNNPADRYWPEPAALAAAAFPNRPPAALGLLDGGHDGRNRRDSRSAPSRTRGSRRCAASRGDPDDGPSDAGPRLGLGRTEHLKDEPLGGGR